MKKKKVKIPKTLDDIILAPANEMSKRDLKKWLEEARFITNVSKGMLTLLDESLKAARSSVKTALDAAKIMKAASCDMKFLPGNLKLDLEVVKERLSDIKPLCAMVREAQKVVDKSERLMGGKTHQGNRTK